MPLTVPVSMSAVCLALYSVDYGIPDPYVIDDSCFFFNFIILRTYDNYCKANFSEVDT